MADNGPGWVAVLLESAEAVLALRPSRVEMDVGVVGPYPPGSPEAFELRAFCPKDGGTLEHPVTGSLNASVAGWLLATGRAAAPYVAREGTVLGRRGRVHISRDDDGTIWVGGQTSTCIRGRSSYPDKRCSWVAAKRAQRRERVKPESIGIPPLKRAAVSRQRLVGIDHVALEVDDVEQALDF